MTAHVDSCPGVSLLPWPFLPVSRPSSPFCFAGPFSQPGPVAFCLGTCLGIASSASVRKSSCLPLLCPSSSGPAYCLTSGPANMNTTAPWKTASLSLNAKVRACHQAVYTGVPINGHNSRCGGDVAEGWFLT